MARNTFKNEGGRGRSRKADRIISLIIFFIFTSLFIWYWVSDDDYERFMKANRVDYLMDQRAYRMVDALLDTAVKSSGNKAIAEDLKDFAKEVKEKIKQENPSEYFPQFLEKVDGLRTGLRFDSALNFIATADADSNFSDLEKNELAEVSRRLADDKNKLEAGERITVPTNHTVGEGETINGIAYRHGMKPAELRELNELAADVLRLGQVIKVYVKVDYIEHTVKSGENLSFIANKYGKGLRLLKKLNGLTSDRLIIGQVLKIGHIIEETDKPAEKPAETGN